MKIAITGHTSGLGEALRRRWPESIVFSKSNGYDIEDPSCRNQIINEASSCEVFINCAHSGMGQVQLLYEIAASWSKTDRLIINISSNSSDGIKPFPHIYAVEKAALDKASQQLSLLPDSCRIVNVKPGYIDVPRVSHITSDPKIPLDQMVDLISDLISQPLTSNIHTVTILPRKQHPNWYYSDLEFPYFTDSVCEQIRQVAKKVIENSTHFGYEYSNFDHLRFYDIGADIPELKALTDDCLVDARADLFFLPPNISMPVHSDTNDYSNIRSSSIAISILPEDDIPETHWYWSKDAPSCATATWQKNDVKLLNIKSLHGGIKTDHRWRSNLQISLSIGYDRALDMIKEGSLFKRNIVRIKR